MITACKKIKQEQAKRAQDSWDSLVKLWGWIILKKKIFEKKNVPSCMSLNSMFRGRQKNFSLPKHLKHRWLYLFMLAHQYKPGFTLNGPSVGPVAPGVPYMALYGPALGKTPVTSFKKRF